MKITKTKLKQIIKEELSTLSERRRGGGFSIAKAARIAPVGDDTPVGGPMTAVSAQEGMEKIQEIIQSSQMNKSFGFSPNITHKVIEEIRSVLDAIYINEVPKGIQL